MRSRTRGSARWLQSVSAHALWLGRRSCPVALPRRPSRVHLGVRRPEEVARVRRCEPTATDADGRLRTSLDGSPAGFEVRHKFLSEQAVHMSRAEYPQRYPKYERTGIPECHAGRVHAVEEWGLKPVTVRKAPTCAAFHGLAARCPSTVCAWYRGEK
jgi:hypothetical protein